MTKILSTCVSCEQQTEFNLPPQFRASGNPQHACPRCVVMAVQVLAYFGRYIQRNQPHFEHPEELITAVEVTSVSLQKEFDAVIDEYLRVSKPKNHS